MAESLVGRPRKVEENLFIGHMLTNAVGQQIKVTKELASAIYEDLIQCGYVSRGALTDKFST